MVSIRQAAYNEAQAGAALAIEHDATGSPLEAWREDRYVAGLRALTGPTPQSLRRALEEALVDFRATADPATGLAAVHLLQALVLATVEAEQGSR